MRFPLLIAWGVPRQHRTFAVDFTVGRCGADLVFDDEYMARVHAAFAFSESDGCWQVEDRGTCNGTWLMKPGTVEPTLFSALARIRSPLALVKGDIIQAGRILLTVVPMEPVILGNPDVTAYPQRVRSAIAL